MAEEVKRRNPVADIARELYLKSGNECAFPGCNRRMINEEGVFVGQICHIEAAMPGGERFNPKQTNEERRAFSNLMLMCHDHHKVTDDVKNYPVERLKQMKAEHETKFTNIIETISRTIVDYTALVEVPLPSKLERLSQTNEWGATPEQMAQIVPDYADFLDRIRRLPVATRQLLAIMVRRGEEDRAGHITALFPDVVEATGLSQREVYNQVLIMERYKVASMDEDDNTKIYLSKQKSGVSIWGDLQIFCEKIGVSLEEILVNLRFDLLD